MSASFQIRFVACEGGVHIEFLLPNEVHLMALAIVSCCAESCFFGVPVSSAMSSLMQFACSITDE